MAPLGKKFTLRITIPANTTATVYLPTQGSAEVKESGKALAKAKGVKLRRTENNVAVLRSRLGELRIQPDAFSVAR